MTLLLLLPLLLQCIPLTALSYVKGRAECVCVYLYRPRTARRARVDNNKTACKYDTVEMNTAVGVGRGEKG